MHRYRLRDIIVGWSDIPARVKRRQRRRWREYQADHAAVGRGEMTMGELLAKWPLEVLFAPVLRWKRRQG